MQGSNCRRREKGRGYVGERGREEEGKEGFESVMVSVILRLAKEGARRVISLIVATSLMLLFTTGIGGVYSGKWILFVEGGSAGGGGGGRSGGFWSSAAAPSNVGIAIAVTAVAGLALAVTVVYSRR